MHEPLSSAAPETGAEQAVALSALTKVYRSRGGTVAARHEVTLVFAAGSFTAVMGPSGSGKSTLLQCAAGLDPPTSGETQVAGHDLGGLSEAKLTVLRRERIGFVFQSFSLMPSLTAELNAALPLRLAGRGRGHRQVQEALAAVGLLGRARHRLAELSGGQQQRVATGLAHLAARDLAVQARLQAAGLPAQRIPGLVWTAPALAEEKDQGNGAQALKTEESDQ